MADLIIKPLAGAGNTVRIQDQAGGSILTSADSGATIDGGVTIPAAGITGTLVDAVQDNITRLGSVTSIKLAPTASSSAPTGTQGAMYYDSDNNWVASIDFGDGTCDQWATKTWDVNMFPDYPSGSEDFSVFDIKGAKNKNPK